MLGVDARTLKQRIESGELRTETKRGEVMISNTELIRAFPEGRFQSAPRGNTRKGT